MAYSIPVFPIVCNIWTGGVVVGLPRVPGAQCNLAWGKRVNVASTGGTGEIGVPLVTMTLLLPAATDIRGRESSSGSDAVEVPAGSGRFYLVAFADFIGYGFANAHKGAVLQHFDPFKTPDV